MIHKKTEDFSIIHTDVNTLLVLVQSQRQHSPKEQKKWSVLSLIAFHKLRRRVGLELLMAMVSVFGEVIVLASMILKQNSLSSCLS